MGLDNLLLQQIDSPSNELSKIGGILLYNSKNELDLEFNLDLIKKLKKKVIKTGEQDLIYYLPKILRSSAGLAIDSSLDNYEKAINLYDSAFNISKGIGTDEMNKFAFFTTEEAIIRISNSMVRDFDLIENFSEKGINLVKERISDKGLAYRNFEHTLIAFKKLGEDLDYMIKWNRKYINYLKELGDSSRIFYQYTYLAENLWNNEEFDECQTAYSNVLKYVNEENNHELKHLFNNSLFFADRAKNKKMYEYSFKWGSIAQEILMNYNSSIGPVSDVSRDVLSNIKKNT